MKSIFQIFMAVLFAAGILSGCCGYDSAEEKSPDHYEFAIQEASMDSLVLVDRDSNEFPFEFQAKDQGIFTFIANANGTTVGLKILLPNDAPSHGDYPERLPLELCNLLSGLDCEGESNDAFLTAQLKSSDCPGAPVDGKECVSTFVSDATPFTFNYNPTVNIERIDLNEEFSLKGSLRITFKSRFVSGDTHCVGVAYRTHGALVGIKEKA